MNRTTFTAVLAVSSLLASLASAQAPYVPPRNIWGQPDLQGVWNFSSNVPSGSCNSNINHK